MRNNRKLKPRFRKLFKLSSFLLVFLFMTHLITNSFAEQINYIYFDLNCGNVEINASTYTGCVFKTIDGVTSTETVTGNHLTTNNYYIYQSNNNNKTQSGIINNGIVVPTYQSLNATISKFINNVDVEDVITTWSNDASGIGRTSTPNSINISGNSLYNVLIDNLWSSYHPTGTSRKQGGITVLPSSGMKTSLKLKGENRFGNIYYNNSSSNSSLEITSAEGSAKNSGALVIANLVNNAKNNYWNSGIGGSDSSDAAVGININGGTIFVGTTVGDNCTAIGGGGNGKGVVTISGGIVTAISSSTGTAIGGGIGMSSYGGDANVNISGGEVYAYNFGQVYSGSFVPGVAIGGGSSKNSTGNLNTTVTITGGKVYAQSLGGVAIGGGSSVTQNGGPATINISNNADVTAKSIEGTYKYNNVEYPVLAGSGIGGGTGGTSGNGGDATVTISGGTINSGTIGGGETNNTSGTVGSATIKIEDGNINGRVIMNIGTFEMTGGVLSGGVAENGGCLQMYSGTASITGGEIKNCEATSYGGAIYIGGGTFYSKGGKIHNNKALSGGGVYIADGAVEISDGSIEQNKTTSNGAGVYIGNNGYFKMTGGTIFSNVSTEGNGGGVFIADGSLEMTTGKIENNEAQNGGGSYISGGLLNLSGGLITQNKSEKNGGGIYINSGTVEVKNGEISNNEAENGAGGYISGGTFDLTGGKTVENKATKNGGGYYILNTTTVSLSNGEISNNEAENGGGFYQTQTTGTTSTTLSGTCYVNNNKAINGNGGGIYINGGSTFRIINGKVIYNSSTGIPKETDKKSKKYNNNVEGTEEIVYAKDSSAGVGGGVYIKEGLFTMKNVDGIYGNAAIFGNNASYSADDLFAYGSGQTSFDAIPVLDMEKDDAYLNSTDWYEDYPNGEYHKSLKEEDEGVLITSYGRYKSIVKETELVKANSVLKTSEDYICITMGANVGTIIIRINDENVGSDNIFKYEIKDSSSTLNMKTSVIQGKETKIVNVPIGLYSLKLESNWSWRYSDKFEATITKGIASETLDRANEININVIGGQTLIIDTKYEIINKKYFTKNIQSIYSNNLNTTNEV